MLHQARGFQSSESASESIVIFVSAHPLCIQVPHKVNSDEMPILGFEKHRYRKYLSRGVQRAVEKASLSSTFPVADYWDSECDSHSSTTNSSETWDQRPGALRSRAHAAHRELLLLTGYANSPGTKPLHCRRTLDQFSYYMLESTERRDNSQVAYRWAKRARKGCPAKDRPIIMVDQLWLWALRDGQSCGQRIDLCR